jgi:hypothetical protein
MNISPSASPTGNDASEENSKKENAPIHKLWIGAFSLDSEPKLKSLVS